MKNYEVVLRRVEEDLAAERLQIGGRLPGERILAGQLGISRPSVREAVRVLEALGVVRTATGSGPDAGAVIVAEPTAPLTALLRLHLATRHLPMGDIVQTRVLLETWAASEAALRFAPAPATGPNRAATTNPDQPTPNSTAGTTADGSARTIPRSTNQPAVSGAAHAVAGDAASVTGDGDPVAGDSGPVAGDSGPVAGDSGPVAGDSGPVAGDSGREASGGGPVAGVGGETVAGDAAQAVAGRTGQAVAGRIDQAVAGRTVEAVAGGAGEVVASVGREVVAGGGGLVVGGGEGAASGTAHAGQAVPPNPRMGSAGEPAGRLSRPSTDDAVDGLARTEELLAAMERDGLSPEEFHRLDAEFHVLLAGLAGNVLIEAVMASLRSAIHGYVLAAVPNLPDWETTAAGLRREHRAILAAIRTGRAEDAARLVRDHILGFYQAARLDS